MAHQVFNFLVFFEQVEHVLHVNEVLLDHAVVGAEPVQWRVQLGDVGGEEHVVSHGEADGAVRHVVGAQQGTHQKTRTDNSVLESVEQAQTAGRFPFLCLRA